MRRLVETFAVAALLCGSALADTRRLPVPSVTLYPGDAIGAEAVVMKAFNGNESIWRNYALETTALEGKFARRTLVAGSPIALAAIKDREVVKRGVAAKAIFQSGGLEITAQLMPLESGANGDVIAVRNLESGLTLRATVLADGSLLVGSP